MPEDEVARELESERRRDEPASGWAVRERERKDIAAAVLQVRPLCGVCVVDNSRAAYLHFEISVFRNIFISFLVLLFIITHSLA